MKRVSVTAAAFVLAIVLTPCESYAQRDLPLHEAAKAGNLSAVKTLIAGGADPNAKERGSGITPLHLALIYREASGIPEIALELIEAGANPNAVARWRSDWKKPYIFVYPLRLALSNEVNPVVVMALLDAGADPKSSALNGDTTLHWAARLRNAPSDGSMAAVPELVKTLIAAGVDPNDRNKAAYTPLQVAAGKNPNPAVVKALIAGGADLEARGGKYGATPLHWAALNNANPTVIKALIAGGADPKSRAKDGATPLHWATRQNDNPAAVVKALLEAGADPKLRDEIGETPLHWAAPKTDDPTVVEALLAAGADPKARSESGTTPLHRAAVRGKYASPAVVEALLAAGADPNAEKKDGATPLHWAAERGNPAIVKALLEAGADPNAERNDATPLYWAAGKGDNPAFIETLIPTVVDAMITAGANLGVVSDKNVTRISRAGEWINDNPAVVKTLIPAVVETLKAAAGNYGSTAPHWAEVVKTLIAGGADPKARDEIGATPLHWAARQKKNANPAVVKMLIAAGADLNVRTKDGNPPLHWAAERGTPAVVEALLAAGADPKARNEAGRVPFDLAKNNKALKGTDVYWRLSEARFKE